MTTSFASPSRSSDATTPTGDGRRGLNVMEMGANFLRVRVADSLGQQKIAPASIAANRLRLPVVGGRGLNVMETVAIFCWPRESATRTRKKFAPSLSVAGSEYVPFLAAFTFPSSKPSPSRSRLTVILPGALPTNVTGEEAMTKLPSGNG